jgi:hypothetical protein
VDDVVPGMGARSEKKRVGGRWKKGVRTEEGREENCMEEGVRAHKQKEDVPEGKRSVRREDSQARYLILQWKSSAGHNVCSTEQDSQRYMP